MSDIGIQRRSRSFPVIVGTAVSDSSSVPMDDAAGAAVSLSAPSSSVTTLHIYGSDHPAGTFRKLDGTGITLVRLSEQLCTTITVVDGTNSFTQTTCTTFYSSVSGHYVMPDGVFPVGAIKLVANGPLGAGVDVRVITKS